MGITKDNFIVITSGPGAGKSTVVEQLFTMGFQCVEETARKIIKERKEKGLPPRPAPGEFARQLFNVDVENYHLNINTTGMTFFDRSLLDSASMIIEAAGESQDVFEIINSCRFNKRVFVAPPWKEIYSNDTERDQFFEESVDVYERLSKWYRSNGYILFELPRLSVDDRIGFIWSTWKNGELDKALNPRPK